MAELQQEPGSPRLQVHSEGGLDKLNSPGRVARNGEGLEKRNEGHREDGRGRTSAALHCPCPYLGLTGPSASSASRTGFSPLGSRPRAGSGVSPHCGPSGPAQLRACDSDLSPGSGAFICAHFTQALRGQGTCVGSGRMVAGRPAHGLPLQRPVGAESLAGAGLGPGKGARAPAAPPPLHAPAPVGPS